MTVDESTYAFVIQMYRGPAPKSLDIVGSAVERIDVSSADKKVVMHSAGNMAQKRHVFFVEITVLMVSAWPCTPTPVGVVFVSFRGQAAVGSLILANAQQLCSSLLSGLKKADSY